MLISPQVAATPAHAQCLEVCGDVNGDLAVTASDWITLFKEVAFVGWINVVNEACGDVDDFAGVNIRDVVVWDQSVFGGLLPLDCEPDRGRYVPIPNDDYAIRYNRVFPPGDSVCVVYLDLTADSPHLALSIILRVDVDGATPSYGEIDMVQNWSAQQMLDHSIYFGNPGVLSGAWQVLLDPLPAGRYLMASVEVIMPPSSDHRAITIELIDSIAPGEDVPMLIDSALVGWELNLEPWFVDLTGDANNDRSITAADLVSLINHIYRGGTAPLPVPAAGDTDCSGYLNAADLIVLVNYVFKSGAPPCDVESECTIDFDLWTCP